MVEEKRLPWMKWYARDWRGDGALRGCSFAARGLWADLLTIIHDEGEPYGHLIINGHAPDSVKLGRMLGGAAREIDRLTAELEGAGVFSRTESGAIYSRRMVRDKAKAEEDRANGKRGGNRQLIGSDNGGVNPPLNGQDKAQNPEPNPIPREEQKNISSFVVGRGKRGGAGVTIEDPNERIARFQRTIAQALGKNGWTIVAAAADPTSPDYEQALQACKSAAQRIGKGWPRLWPAPQHSHAAGRA